MKKHLAAFVLIIFLSACVPTTTVPANTPTPTVEPATLTPSNNIVTSTVTTIPPTVTLPITNTPEVTSTPTLQPISAPTVIYDKNVGAEAKCVEVNQNLQTGSLGTGVVILESRKTAVSNDRYQRGFYFLNMETGNLIDLIGGNDNFGGISVSPDRTLLSVDHVIFGDGDKIVKDELLLMSADGKIQKALPWGKDWVRVVIWRDNQHLLINIVDLKHDESTGPKPARLLWLNPFTGEQRILISDFPNLYDGSMGGASPTVYNPAFTRAGYLAMPGNVYVLWDLQKKKALLSWVNISNDDPPLWSPDGSKFLMTVIDPSDTPGIYPNGFYLVDNNGTVLLPALSDNFDRSNISVIDYFWSPSGRSVAFLADAFDGSNGEYTQKLLVMDIRTRQIMDYCVEFTPSYNGDPSLIWSPDETQILLNDDYSLDHMHKRAILVDLAKGTAFPIAEDMVATGWMKAP